MSDLHRAGAVALRDVTNDRKNRSSISHKYKEVIWKSFGVLDVIAFFLVWFFPMGIPGYVQRFKLVLFFASHAVIYISGARFVYQRYDLLGTNEKNKTTKG